MMHIALKVYAFISETYIPNAQEEDKKHFEEEKEENSMGGDGSRGGWGGRGEVAIGEGRWGRPGT